MKYLVNVDWVELYCEFDSLLFRNEFATPHATDLHGFGVLLREYGTRVYANVASITYHGEPFAVITYNPLSSLDRGGIMSPLMCHIKLENEWCYKEDWWDIMKHALRVFRINPKRLSRADLCCDVQWFECGMYAADLCMGLIRRKYYKIHQPNWSAHGQDARKITWNSLSFGSASSQVFTRFYNKSLELKQKKDKQYIRECWKIAGLKEDKDVWRIEFALKDSGLSLIEDRGTEIDSDTGEVQCRDVQHDITPDVLADRSKLEEWFLRYAQHYFDIRKNTGASRYDCPPLRLLPTTPRLFRPIQRPHLGTMTRTDRMVINRLLDTIIKSPNRHERWEILKAIQLYQSYRRIEMLSDKDILNWRAWLYMDISDDDRLVDKNNMLFAESV